MNDFSRFVGGHLTGVKVCQGEKRVALFLREALGKNWIATAEDVSELMILQMCMQNIIDRISIWDASSNEVEYRRKIFSLIQGTFVTEKSDLNLPIINKAVDMIGGGDAILIELEPVYGAVVLILAREISLVEGLDP